ERGAQREPHAQAADEHARLIHGSQPPARERRESLFGAVHEARHQRLAIRQDHVLAVALRQRQQAAVGRSCFAEKFPRFHVIAVRTIYNGLPAVTALRVNLLVLLTFAALTIALTYPQ